MRRRSTRLIDEVEQDALDANVPISTPLRKLVALGGQAGSAERREWASRELRGYVGSDVPLPDYRQPGATLRIDGATFGAMITRQLISPSELPERVNEHIDQTAPLNGGVAEIEATIEAAKRDPRGEVKLTLPMGQDVVRLMNYEIQQRGDNDRVTAIYWSVSHVTLGGVLDQIRTRLVELVAEMRAATPDEAAVPTSAARRQRGLRRHPRRQAARQRDERTGKRRWVALGHHQRRRARQPLEEDRRRDRRCRRRGRDARSGRSLAGLEPVLAAVVVQRR